MRSLPANTILRSISIYCPILFFRKKKFCQKVSVLISDLFRQILLISLSTWTCRFCVQLICVSGVSFVCFQVLFICSYVYYSCNFCFLIMRPSSVGGGRILRRTLSVRLSVCLSVRPSVPCLFTLEPSYERTSKIEKNFRFRL